MGSYSHERKHLVFHKAQRKKGMKTDVWIVANGEGKELSKFYVLVVPKKGIVEEEELSQSFLLKGANASFVDLGNVDLSLPEEVAQKKWKVEGIQYSTYIPPQEHPVALESKGEKIVAHVSKRITEPFIMYFNAENSK